MSDKELLELAAKAAGINAEWFTHANGTKGGPFIGNSGWNPLTDDGDALRLAASLKLAVIWPAHLNGYVYAVGAGVPGPKEASFVPLDSIDAAGALRRAIVRAAAEIGKVAP